MSGGGLAGVGAAVGFGAAAGWAGRGPRRPRSGHLGDVGPFDFDARRDARPVIIFCPGGGVREVVSNRADPSSSGNNSCSEPILKRVRSPTTSPR